jgi:RNA polymerase sigma-70 factor (ECF subfamily)
VEFVPDEIIMQKVKEGNLSELSLLFERYNKKLYNYFLKTGLERDISQDLTQNLFYRMIKYRNTYKEGYCVKSWIYQMARNLHNDFRNNQKKSDNLISREESYSKDVSEESETFHEEDYEKLERALLSLSDEQREIIVLSRFQKMKYEEISTILDQSVPAIKVAVHRAIKQLRCIYFQQV